VRARTFSITILFFILLRVVFLTSLPIVTDEAIYMHWGSKFLTTWDDPQMPLSLQGKQAATLLTLGISQLAPLDPLVAARLSTVLFSLLVFLAFQSNSLALLLLATSPLFLFFNRLAIPDTAVAASYTLAMVLAFKLQKKPTVLHSLLLGLTVAVGWWFKSTALLALPAIFFTVGIRGILPILIALLFSIGLIQIPLLHRVVPLSQTEHVFTIAQLLAFPWTFWLNNVVMVLEAILIMSSPIALLAFFQNKIFKQKTLWIWFLTPVVSEIVLAKIFNLRYLIMAVPAFCLLLAFLLERKRIFSGIVVTTSLFLSVFMVVNPIGFYTSLTLLSSVKQDISQYVTGWASGWGVKETAEFLQNEAKSGPITVFVRLDSGNPESAMYVYLRNNKNIRILPITYLPSVPTISSYFVSRGTQYADLGDRLEEVIRFPKPLDNEFVGIYRIN